MGQIIRARQRAITAIFPHQGNNRYLIPSRFGMIPDQVPAFQTTQVIVEFHLPVSGTTGDTGWTVLINGSPVLIGLVTQPQANLINLAFPLQTIGDVGEVRYNGLGDWTGANGFVVGQFAQSGILK